jgi:hypothetical protein
MIFTASNILDAIDAYSRDFGHSYYSRFPRMLGNEDHVYHVAARMTLFRDTKHWAILIEHLSYMPRAGGTQAVHLRIHPFGNCLRRYPLSSNAFWNSTVINPVRYFPIPPKDDETFWEYVPDCVHSIVTHKRKRIPISRQPRTYRKLGLRGLENENGLHLSCVLRAIAHQYREELFASDRALRSHLRIKVPQFLRLNDWFHPFLLEDEMPSEISTIRQIAHALASGNSRDYRAPENPSCHWRFWQDPLEMLENEPVDDEELDWE